MQRIQAYMEKLYYKIFIALIFIGSITGCKLDPPIYPAGTALGNGGTNGSASGYIKIKIGDINYTFNNNASFTSFTAGSPEAQQVGATDGQTSLGAFGNTQTDVIALVFRNATTGTFDLPDITAGNFVLAPSPSAQINVTVLTNKKIEGTFTADMADANDNTKIYRNCPGSFSISK